MKTLKYYFQASILLLALVLLASCNKDNSVTPEKAAWELEVEQVMAATSKYADFSVAEAEGLIDVSGYVPNMGHHYLNPTLSDGTFELEKPEIILYAPDADSNMQMIAIEYSIVPADPANPGSPPEGFTGDQDEWHFNEMIGQWQLHVWTVMENPDGLFAPFNPAMGD